MANDIFARLAILISANNAEFAKVLNNSSSQLSGFGKAISGVNNLLKGFGIGFGIYQIKGGIEDAIKTLATFEQTMQEVKAITGATGDEFESLRNDSISLGASTKFTADEVGKLQVAYGRLGFTTKEILAATKATLDLSAATGEDLAKSADVAGSTVRGFGLDASETQRVVDVMASSFNKTALGLDNFTESMKYVAPIANAANISVEETTALLGVLADNGIRGSNAGTALRKIFGELSKDGRPVQERLAELGKKGLTLADSFDEVGRTAQTALLVLSKNVDKSNELTAAFHNVSGEAAQMARIMQDSLIGDVEKLSSAYDGLIQRLGNTGIFRSFIESQTQFLNALQGQTDLDSEFKGLAFGIKDNLQPSIDLATERLKEFRKEAGRPFDDKLAGDLAKKYGLTEEQANKLWQAIVKINASLNDQEKAVSEFKAFAAGGNEVRRVFENLSEASAIYKDDIYKLILAKQIEKAKLEEASRTVPELTKANLPLIKSIDDQIEAYYKAIPAINDYVVSQIKAAKAIDGQAVAVTGLINQLNEQIKAQESLRNAAKDVDSIGKYNDKIKGLREELELLNATSSNTTQTFKDLDKGLNADIPNAATRSYRHSEQGQLPDFVPVIDGTDIVTSHLEKVNKAFDESSSKAHNWALGTDGAFHDVAKAVIDIGPLVAGGLTTIGEALGYAFSGAENFGASIIKAFASFAKQFGEILIGAGVAALELETLIENPVGAIVAGVALVALATAATSAVKASQKSTLGGGGGSRGVSASAYSTSSMQPIPIVVTGRLEAQGSTLVAVINNQGNKSGRTG